MTFAMEGETQRQQGGNDHSADLFAETQPVTGRFASEGRLAAHVNRGDLVQKGGSCLWRAW